MSFVSVNKSAEPFFERMFWQPDYFRVVTKARSNGARLIDAGCKVQGGIESGIILTKICMGGLSRVQISQGKFENLILPTIHVSTDSPAISTLASQYAGWRIRDSDPGVTAKTRLQVVDGVVLQMPVSPYTDPHQHYILPKVDRCGM